MVSEDWKNALAATPQCIAIERLGDPLSDAEREHVQHCVRCQTEFALYADFNRDEKSAEGEFIANELQRRFAESNVRPFKPRAFRLLYAAAAALVILIGAGVFLQTREPALNPIDGPEIYRGARLEAIAPIGDLAQAPNELRWSPVANASRYRVQIMEVDRTVLWRGESNDSRIAIPSTITVQFAPGKSLLWEVTALRGQEVLASSETQTFRVAVAMPRRAQ